MKRSGIHRLVAFTLPVILVGFFVLLSPPFKEIRVLIGLPEDQPGARYNPAVGAAEIINPDKELALFYMARITFVYHSVFAALLYATLIVFARRFLEDRVASIIEDLSLLGALMTVAGGVVYSYVARDFFWHGLFIGGLAVFFVVSIIALTQFRPRGLLEVNIMVAGVLLLLGGLIGAWLGSSFMNNRHSFIEALIQSRFNPDPSEENVFWRALTGHEHAMIAIALSLTFLLALSILGLREGRFTRIMLYLMILGQSVMALASYSVWFFGKIAHLAITPAALVLILATLILSFMTKRTGVLGWGLRIGNVVMWAGVAAPGAIVAISLRKPRFFNPAFRDPAWDWAELAYNIGHWHILLLTWGIMLLLIYVTWPRDLTKVSIVKWASWAATIGYAAASIFINLYMLGNPPGKYVPNPYGNKWLSMLVEPSLGIMSLGIAVTYLYFLKNSIESLFSTKIR